MALPTAALRVDFDRIGRTHNPPALTMSAGQRDWDDVAAAIEKHARPMLGSRFPEAAISERSDGTVEGLIICGFGFQSGGSFTISEVQ